MHSVQNSECSVRDALRYGGACCNGNVGMATLGRAAGLVKARSHMTIGMTTGWQTYANYLAAHWLTVYQWS